MAEEVNMDTEAGDWLKFIEVKSSRPAALPECSGLRTLAVHPRTGACALAAPDGLHVASSPRALGSAASLAAHPSAGLEPSCDGALLAVCSDEVVRVYRFSEPLADSSRCVELGGARGSVIGATWSPTRPGEIAVMRDGGSLCVYNVTAGADEVAERRVAAAPTGADGAAGTCVAWSPDGSQLAVGTTDGDVLVVEPESAEPVRTVCPESNGFAVHQIEWREGLMVIVFEREDDEDDDNSYVLLYDPDEERELKRAYFPSDLLGDFLTVSIDAWDLVVLAVSGGEFTMLHRSSDSGEWTELDMDDADRPTLPFESRLIGMAVEYTAPAQRDPVCAGAPAGARWPILWAHLSDGTMRCWHVYNSSGAPSPCVAVAAAGAAISAAAPAPAPASSLFPDTAKAKSTPSFVFESTPAKAAAPFSFGGAAPAKEQDKPASSVFASPAKDQKAAAAPAFSFGAAPAAAAATPIATPFGQSAQKATPTPAFGLPAAQPAKPASPAAQPQPQRASDDPYAAPVEMMERTSKEVAALSERIARLDFGRIERSIQEMTQVQRQTLAELAATRERVDRAQQDYRESLYAVKNMHGLVAEMDISSRGLASGDRSAAKSMPLDPVSAVTQQRIRERYADLLKRITSVHDGIRDAEKEAKSERATSTTRGIISTLQSNHDTALRQMRKVESLREALEAMRISRARQQRPSGELATPARAGAPSSAPSEQFEAEAPKPATPSAAEVLRKLEHARNAALSSPAHVVVPDKAAAPKFVQLSPTPGKRAEQAAAPSRPMFIQTKDGSSPAPFTPLSGKQESKESALATPKSSAAAQQMFSTPTGAQSISFSFATPLESKKAAAKEKAAAPAASPFGQAASSGSGGFNFAGEMRSALPEVKQSAKPAFAGATPEKKEQPSASKPATAEKQPAVSPFNLSSASVQKPFGFGADSSEKKAETKPAPSPFSAAVATQKPLGFGGDSGEKKAEAGAKPAQSPFGAAATQKPFGFGAESNEKKGDAEAKPLFGATATQKPFGFGADSSEKGDAESKPAQSPFGVAATQKPFGFGAESDKPSQSPFASVFGGQKEQENKAPADSKPALGFAFGSGPQASAEKTPSPSKAAAAEKTPSKPAADNKVAATTSSFGAPVADKPAADDKPAAEAAAPAASGFSFGASSNKDTAAFSFGATPAAADKAAPGFSFGATSAAADKATASGLAFGADASKTAASGFSFATPAKPAADAKQPTSAEKKKPANLTITVPPESTNKAAEEGKEDKPAAASLFATPVEKSTKTPIKTAGSPAGPTATTPQKPASPGGALPPVAEVKTLAVSPPQRQPTPISAEKMPPFASSPATPQKPFAVPESPAAPAAKEAPKSPEAPAAAPAPAASATAPTASAAPAPAPATAQAPAPAPALAPAQAPAPVAPVAAVPQAAVLKASLGDMEDAMQTKPQPQQPQLFQAPAQTAASVFGAPQQAGRSLFGQPSAPTSASSLFGQPSTPTSAPSLFGSQPQQQPQQPQQMQFPSMVPAAPASGGLFSQTPVNLGLFGSSNAPQQPQQQMAGLRTAASIFSSPFGGGAPAQAPAAPMAQQPMAMAGAAPANPFSSNLMGGAAPAPAQAMSFGAGNLTGAGAFGSTWSPQASHAAPVAGAQQHRSLFGGGAPAVSGGFAGVTGASVLGGNPFSNPSAAPAGAQWQQMRR
eukprot:m51a1_g5234 putative nuclear pore complex protein nup214 (1681) ;mRNA; r:303556-308868